ncbi:MAG: carbon-nitrogen hydrolase family protein [Planctomycetota bacterium]|nr:carbon-nitrogen hydrolase family protein [Planctomycetota bacterium]
MSDRLVLGVWQGRCADGDLERNLARAGEVIDEAARAGCDFVCLPETYLSGYGTRELIERGAMTLGDRRLLDLARRAQDRNLAALVGLTERRGAALWNTVAVLDGGRVAGAYTKTLLTGGDARDMGFACDDEIPVFEARGVRFGIQICHDSSFPEVAAIAAFQGARILFSPHYNRIPFALMNEHRVRVRNNHIGAAVHYGLVVARSNVVNADATHLGYGDSAIFAPSGVPLAEAGLFTEALVTADVGPRLSDARFRMRVKELREGLIARWAAAARRAASRA